MYNMPKAILGSLTSPVKQIPFFAFDKLEKRNTQNIVNHSEWS